MALKCSSNTLAGTRVTDSGRAGTQEELGLKLGRPAFHLRFAIGRAPSKTLVSGLRGALRGTGPDPPKGFKRQHRYWVGSYYSSSSHPLKGGQSALWGPLEHLFCPS